MPSPDVETDMATRIEAQIAALSTTGTGDDRNLYPGPERGVDVTPAECTFVEDFGGQFDHHNDGAIPEAQFQVTTRSRRHDYTGAKARAKLVHDALALVDNVVINGTRYIWIRALAGGPTPIGPQDNDSEYFVESFGAKYEVLS